MASFSNPVPLLHDGYARTLGQPLPELGLVGPHADEEGCDAFATLMRAVSRALDADGVVASWQDDGAEPVLLFRDGACDGHTADLITAERIDAAPRRGTVASSNVWHLLDGDPEGGMLTTVIRAEGGVLTITSFFRHIGDSTRRHVREVAGWLSPLIRPFLGLWGTRLRLLSRLRGLIAAVDNSDVGVLLVNRHGDLLFANARAELLIKDNDGLRRKGTMLSATKLADTLRLQAAIDHVASDDGPGAAGTTTPVVALSRRERRALMAAIVGSGTDLHQPDECAAIIYVFDPEQDLHLLVEPACKLYGLSPVETKLACLLANGTSLAEAAARMRVREQTARSYLKQVFQKTDTNRQAELVGLMLKSCIRTQPGARIGLV